jgi:hypothetical protein
MAMIARSSAYACCTRCKRIVSNYALVDYGTKPVCTDQADCLEHKESKKGRKNVSDPGAVNGKV